MRPTPLTDKEYKAMLIEQAEQRESFIDALDNRIVEAKLYYYKGTEVIAKHDQLLMNTDFRSVQYSCERDAIRSCILVGTDRQRCQNSGLDNITGTYTLNLTEDMLKQYELNNKELLIINN